MSLILGYFLINSVGKLRILMFETIYAVKFIHVGIYVWERDTHNAQY